MIRFLSYFLFFLFTFQIHGMEEVTVDEKDPLLGGNNAPFIQYQEKQQLEEINASTTTIPNATQTDLGIDNQAGDLRRRTQGEQLELMGGDVDNRRKLLINLNEETAYVPTNDSETTLFQYMDKAAFSIEDPYIAWGFRWVGRAIGLMGENAVVSMVAYVLFNLFHIAVNHRPEEMGIIDAIMVGGMLAYFLLPATGNMAQGGQEFYEFCDPDPLVPEAYRAIKPCSPLPLSLNIGSKLHATSMAIMLTSVFYHIENSHVASYNWYFLTFFAPYAIAVFNKNKSYFEYGRRTQKISQRSEAEPEKKTRKILEASIKNVMKTYKTLMTSN